MDLIEQLSGDESTTAWIAHLTEIGEPDRAISLPLADDVPPILLDLAIPHEDIDPMVAMLPSRERSPDVWWLVERCAYSLVRTMGAVGEWPPFPKVPEYAGAWHRYFHVYVFLATLPHVREYHRGREIPDRVSRLTLADLGRNVAVHRKGHGVGGLEVQDWPTVHFRGLLYDLGRLQFERATLGNRTGQGIRAAGLPFGPGDPTLSVHIPEFSGPLTPAACDAAIDRAGAFFARHFPEERYEIAVCHSWLLDEQLAEYLPEESNIIRFQRRFQSAYRPAASDDTLDFVFGRKRPPLDDLPQRTTLERAVVGHLKAGRQWHGGVGWLRL